MLYAIFSIIKIKSIQGDNHIFFYVCVCVCVIPRSVYRLSEDYLFAIRPELPRCKISTGRYLNAN